jgi:hypothetical protein
VGADIAGGHRGMLAERGDDAPFRHADGVAPGVEPRQRTADGLRHDVEAIGEELLELEQRRRGLGRLDIH